MDYNIATTLISCYLFTVITVNKHLHRNVIQNSSCTSGYIGLISPATWDSRTYLEDFFQAVSVYFLIANGTHYADVGYHSLVLVL